MNTCLCIEYAYREENPHAVMHFLASTDCICDLHHVFIHVPMCASKDSFSEVFQVYVDSHSLKPSLWLLDWAMLHVGYSLSYSCICHYFHTSVAVLKWFCYNLSGLCPLSHTPKMLYGKVLNNMVWGSVAKICKS